MYEFKETGSECRACEVGREGFKVWGSGFGGWFLRHGASDARGVGACGLRLHLGFVA